MPRVVQTGNFDSQKYGLEGHYYNQVLTHNTQATMETGLVSNKKPYAVLIAEDSGRNFTQSVVGFAWALDGSGRPLVTVQLASGAGTIDARICVLYRVGAK